MYLLMNKDNIVAQFEKIDGLLSEKYQIVSVDGERMPIGFRSMEEWINNRKGSKHNEHLRKLMQMCGCENTEGFIRVTHAATINDTFWVKSENEAVTWNDVSLYRNDFNEVISKLAFEGIGLYGIQLSSTSPELSTEGSFRKCWRREGNDIFLYKRGQSGARNAGLEPYCEMLGAELAQMICKEAISYSTVMLHGELASKCKLFTNEETGYVPIARYGINHHSPDEMLEFYKRIDSEDDFRRMIVLDALTFNVDRHAGNHGVLVANDTLKPIRMAPVFDMNLSMLPYVEKEEFDTIGNKLLEYGPRIGDDFTRMGQAVMTSEIRRDLINMKGYQFQFRGDERFTKERIVFLENLLEKQIDALLQSSVLYTKDVFIPEYSPAIYESIKVDLDAQAMEAEQMGNDLMSSGYFSGHMLNMLEDRVELIMIPVDGKQFEIFIDLSSKEVWIEEDGIVLENGIEAVIADGVKHAYLEVVKYVDHL